MTGRLIYGSGNTVYALDNHTLFHLQAAIQAEFNSGSTGFFVGAAHNTGGSAGSDASTTRSAAWISPNIPITFSYDNTEPLKFDAQTVAEYVKALREPLGFMLPAADGTPFVGRD